MRENFSLSGAPPYIFSEALAHPLTILFMVYLAKSVNWDSHIWEMWPFHITGGKCC